MDEQAPALYQGYGIRTVKFVTAGLILAGIIFGFGAAWANISGRTTANTEKHKIKAEIDQQHTKLLQQMQIDQKEISTILKQHIKHE